MTQPIVMCIVCGQVKAAGQAHVCPGPYEWRRLQRARAQYGLEVELEKLRWPGPTPTR